MEMMFRAGLALVVLAGFAGMALAQSTSAPLIVTATVVSSCNVSAPRQAEHAGFATMPVTVTCVRGSATPRVQRPTEPRRSEIRDAVLVIDF